MQCQTCHTENSENSKFCVGCGARLQGTNPLASLSSEEISRRQTELSRQRRRGIIWLIMPVLSLIIILSVYAIVFFIFRQYYGVSPASGTSLQATIAQLIKVVLGLIGIIAVICIPVGIVVGVSYLRKDMILPGEPYDERSGKGELSEIPPEIQKWSWGAAGLTWIWGGYHRVWRSFWMFLPLLSYFYWIYLGLKGNELAWRKNKWSSVDEFLARQRKWRAWGIALFIIGAVFFSLQILANVAKIRNKSVSNEAVTNVVRDAIYGTNTAGAENEKFVNFLKNLFNYVKSEIDNFLSADKKLADSDLLEFSSFATKAHLADMIRDLEKVIKETDNFESNYDRLVVQMKNLIQDSEFSDREKQSALNGFEQSVNDQEKSRLRKARMLAMKNSYQRMLELYQFFYKNFDHYEVILEGQEEGIYFTPDALADKYNLLLGAVQQAGAEFEEAEQTIIDYLNKIYRKKGINLDAAELRDFMNK